MEDSFLVFNDGTSPGNNTCACMPASSLVGVRLVDAESCNFIFEPVNNQTGKATICLVHFTSGTFKEAMKAVSGALNSNTMVVVGDALNNVFLEYPGGTFKAGVSVDEVA